MDLDELRARVKERVRSRAGLISDGVDDFHRDALAFFARVPEPPLYRRRDDPTRAVAATLLEESYVLLARASVLGGTALDDFTTAIEAHALVLASIATGKVESLEGAWQRARVLERQASAPLRLWSLTDAGRPKVFDGATGTSRFDPRPETQVDAKLVCPWCRAVGGFRLSPRVATHSLVCANCRRAFTAYLGELKTLELERHSKRRRYRFRLDDLSHVSTLVEVDDASAGELSATRGDLLGFLYAGDQRLTGVLNLNTSRVLWVTRPGPCFVATVAFGEGAPELETLRAFRDEVLARSAPGRSFIAWYYRTGPALAEVVSAHPPLRRVVRRCLWATVRLVELRS